MLSSHYSTSKSILFVPAASLDTYKTAEVWKEFLYTKDTGIAEVVGAGSIRTDKNYDLLGRRVANGSLRGVTVRNGKKVLNK